MTKKTRQGRILDLISSGTISTQTELAAALADAGIDVTQTTISRDLNDLGVVKVRSEGGQLVYAPAGARDPDQEEALGLALKRWVMDVSHSENIVVLRTPNGFADPVSQAIDDSRHRGVLATLAGENTVLVVAEESVGGATVAAEFSALLGWD